MAAMFFKWLPKWWMQWHDVFGNTFYDIYAPQNIDIESKLKHCASYFVRQAYFSGNVRNFA